MAGHGPPRKPTAFLEFTGSHRAKSRGKTEPKPPKLDGLKPPRGLRRSAAVYWRKIAPKLAELGVLTVCDEGALILVCEAWDDYHDAAKMARDKKDPQRLKWAQVRDRKWPHVLNGLKEFGCTPANRSRVEVMAPGNIPAGTAATPIKQGRPIAGFAAMRQQAKTEGNTDGPTEQNTAGDSTGAGSVPAPAE